MNMIQPPFTRTALLMLTCWSILSSAQDDPRFAKVSLFGANNYTVGLRDTPDGRSFCGGTLVTPRHVLTAGSCASTSVPYVSVGAYYAKGSKRNGSTEIPVSQTIVHPQLDNPLYANDIAILVLKVPVKSSLNIDYAQLMTSLCPEGTVGKISGWGNVDHHSSPRIPLKEDAVRVISREDCQEKLGVHYNVEIHESMLCADSGQASCNGDSGGPMVFKIEGNPAPVLTGVVSFGKPCGSNVPDAYSRISHFRDWIDSVIGPDEGLTWAGF